MDVFDDVRNRTIRPSRSRSRLFAISARRTTTGPVETHRGGRRKDDPPLGLNMDLGSH